MEFMGSSPRQHAPIGAEDSTARQAPLRVNVQSRTGSKAKAERHANESLSPMIGEDILPGILPTERSREVAPSGSSTPVKGRHGVWPQPPRPLAVRGLSGLENGSDVGTLPDTPTSAHRRRSKDNRKASLRIQTNGEPVLSEGGQILSPVQDIDTTTRRFNRGSLLPSTSEKDRSPRSPRSHGRAFKSPARSSPPKDRTPVQPARPAVHLNPRRLYRLMTTTGGKMQGDLLIWLKDFQYWQPAYCTIDVASGRLLQESIGARPERIALVPDLRGCKTKAASDIVTGLKMLIVISTSGGFKTMTRIRPENEKEFDEWFSAFLCWQTVRPKQPLHDADSRWIPKAMEWSADTTARALGLDLGNKKAAAIKAGELSYLDLDNPPPAHPHSSALDGFRPTAVARKRWVKVYCILQQSGEFSLSRAGDLDPVARIDLSRFPRSAIQRLSPSVSGVEFGIAIHPQYSRSDDACSQLRPMFLALDTRPLFEAWYVLLRAMANPVLYSAARPSSLDSIQPFAFLPGISSQSMEPDLIRISSPLSFRIMSARIRVPPRITGSSVDHAIAEEDKSSSRRASEYYVEIVHDGQVKARTTARTEDSSPSWHESFEFCDWPTASSCVTIRLNTQSSARSNSHAAMPSLSTFTSPKLDSLVSDVSVFAEATLDLDEISVAKGHDSWWPLTNSQGTNVGELLMEIKASRDVILMDKEFKDLSALLHNFSSALTLQIAEKIPFALSRLSECLLNVFQVSGQAAEWLMSLAEEEIDGVLKESPTSRMRFTARHDSDENIETVNSFGPSGEREAFVRDLGKSVTQEANLLFRGNTIFSKALDLHMKRLGKEYLEQTLGAILRNLNEQDLNCEVDPNKLMDSADVDHELPKNWRRLIAVTEDVWKAIYRSAERCPQELRMIFRHVRACADDRYGDFLRSVSYSSVSGFLFLRFFCAAILNPNMFGLLKAQPKLRAKRTFTLVAKSLQGLANMTSFGSKESWMEPMNSFLISHRREFKDFIDVVCSISPAGNNLPIILPPYSTPYAMYSRVPAAVREGYLYLPYLICATVNAAAVVNVWLDNHEGPGARKNSTSSMNRPPQPLSGDLLLFHTACLSLRARADSLYAAVERTEYYSSPTTQKWVVLAERLESRPEEFLATELELAADEQPIGRTVRQRSTSTPAMTGGGKASLEDDRAGLRHPLGQGGADADPWSGGSSDNEQSGLGSGRPKEKADKGMLGIFGWMKKTGHGGR